MIELKMIIHMILRNGFIFAICSFINKKYHDSYLNIICSVFKLPITDIFITFTKINAWSKQNINCSLSLLYDITFFKMKSNHLVYMSDSNPIGMKMSVQGHPLEFNERRGNHHTTGQAAGYKTLLYTGTARELPLHTQVTVLASSQPFAFKIWPL